MSDLIVRQTSNPVIEQSAEALNPAEITMPSAEDRAARRQAYVDSLSFNDAFGDARKSGAQTFMWRGKSYGTQLANPRDTRGLEAKETYRQLTYDKPYLWQAPYDGTWRTMPVKVPYRENISTMQEGGQAPSKYYNEKGWPVSAEIISKARPGRIIYEETPTARGNNNYLMNQLQKKVPDLYKLPVFEIEYNRAPVAHYILDEGTMTNWPISGEDLVNYNNRKAQWDQNKIKKH